MNTFKVGDEVVVKRESVDMPITDEHFGLTRSMVEAAERQYKLNVVSSGGIAVCVYHETFQCTYSFHAEELEHYFLNLENE